MGALGRFGEKVKQAFGCGIAGEKDWKPSSNKRNNAMLKECKKFAHCLRALKNEVLAWGNVAEGGLGTMKTMLESSLPRAYHETAMGVEPLSTTEEIVGQGVRCDQLPATVDDMKEQLSMQVLEPVEQWLSGYRIIKDRNKKCERVRLDLDAQTREATVLTEKYNKQVAKDDQADAVESLKFKMQIAEDKKQRLSERYNEMENEIYHALLIQVLDSTALREHIAGAIFIMQTTFNKAYLSFNLNQPVEPPLMPAGFDTSNRLVQSTLLENSKTLRMSMARASLGGVEGGGMMGGPGSVGGGSMGGASMAHGGAQPAYGGKPVGGGLGKIGDDDDDGENPFAKPSGGGGAAAKPGAEANPFAGPAKSTSPDVAKKPEAGAAKKPGGGAGLPAPPAWYTEAREKARAPNETDDDSDDGGNPFASSAAKYASNPSSRPGTWRGQRPSMGAFKA